MQRDFEGTIYVRDAADVRLEDGMVHICYTSRRMHIEIVERPSTFLKALRAGNKIAAEFHARGDVVGIKDHAASS